MPADTPADGARAEGRTPAAQWRAEGKPDPHSDRYDCERAKLALGSMTDDELANAVFMHGNERLDLAAVMRGEPSPIAYLTAAKDRIRWLSRALEAALAAPTAGAGRALVPREPTAEMIRAGENACSGCAELGFFPPELLIWRAMWDAAAPPAASFAVCNACPVPLACSTVERCATAERAGADRPAPAPPAGRAPAGVGVEKLVRSLKSSQLLGHQWIADDVHVVEQFLNALQAQVTAAQESAREQRHRAQDAEAEVMALRGGGAHGGVSAEGPGLQAALEIVDQMRKDPSCSSASRVRLEAICTRIRIRMYLRARIEAEGRPGRASREDA